jgi:hypothetical protein
LHGAQEDEWESCAIERHPKEVLLLDFSVALLLPSDALSPLVLQYFPPVGISVPKISKIRQISRKYPLVYLNNEP